MHAELKREKKERKQEEQNRLDEAKREKKERKLEEQQRLDEAKREKKANRLASLTAAKAMIRSRHWGAASTLDSFEFDEKSGSFVVKTQANLKVTEFESQIEVFSSECVVLLLYFSCLSIT